ncbi:MAG: ABC transporter permease [Planctomycetes bacterium]|nr:ABC transporter permease [Planctomycetota bacterium]MCC7395468.1 ABC transporter permease [Planctomycetota bacterium]
MRELLNFLPYALRTALRARTRSLLTVLGAALAMMLFTFVRTVDDGVQDLARRSVQPVLVVFQDSRFCPLTSDLPVRYESDLRDIPGVTAVLPTLLYINSCRSNLDLVTLHGVTADELEKIYTFDVLQGSVAAWRDRPDAALVGERLAERRRIKIGERVRLGEVDLHVAGIVRSDSAAVANLAFVHLDQLALARKRQGAATEFLVRVAPDADPEAIARAIDERFRTDEARTDTKSMQAFVAAAIAEVAQVVSFARWLGYLGVLIVALVVANTVFISAESRAAEMGVLETVGMVKSRLMLLIAAEGVGLSLVGGVLGAGLVVLLLYLWPVTLGVEGNGIDLVPGVATAASALTAALVVGVVASLPPAFAVARRALHLGIKAE